MELGPAGEVDRGSLGELQGDDARPRSRRVRRDVRHRRTAPSPVSAPRVYAGLGAYASTAAPGRPDDPPRAHVLRAVHDPEHPRHDLRRVHQRRRRSTRIAAPAAPRRRILLERLMDLFARKIGMDPVEVRRKNLIPKDKFPYTVATGLTYDSGDYEGALDKALERVRLRGLPRRAGGGARGRTATSASASRPTSRSAGSAPRRWPARSGSAAGSTSQRDRSGLPHRRGAGLHRRQAARPGRGDDVRADRGRRVRHPGRERRDRARRHRDHAAGVGHVRQPDDGGLRRGGEDRRAPGEGKGARSSPPTCSRRTRPISSGRTASSSCAARRRPGEELRRAGAHGERRLEHAGRHGARARGDRVLRPDATSSSRSGRTSARSRSTWRPAR